MKYYDRNNKRITDGVTLIHIEPKLDGAYTEKVFQVYYPLSEFALAEWAIQDQKTPQNATIRPLEAQES